MPAALTLSRYGRLTALEDHADLTLLRRIKWLLLKGQLGDLSAVLEQQLRGYAQMDPLVDGLNADGVGWLRLVQQRQGSADPRVLQLQEQFYHLPDWFDPKLAEVGAGAYRRYPLLLVWLLRNVALMAGYSIPALSLPLIQTGALVHDALARLMRTYDYILSVAEPDGLTVGHRGWMLSLRVRHQHSRVREQLRKDHWDVGYWGQPINQTDMIATHLQFSLLIMRGFQLLGARLSAEEKQGILHLWQRASQLMGVEVRQLPQTETDSWRWLYVYLATQRLDYALGRPLAHALHDLPTQIMGEHNRIGQFTEALNASLTRMIVGDDVADGLGLPRPVGRQGVLLVPPIQFATDTLRQHSPLSAQWLEHIRQRRQEKMNWWLKEQGVGAY